MTMPPARFIETNGVRLAVHEAGPRVGPPVVVLHGFPELAYSWRHQIPALAAAGRWVIAPDQRGYGRSDGPRAVEAYDIEQLTGDLVGLLDALGAETAVWVGHDWGGLVGWQLPLRHPERTAGVVGLNTPFLPRGPVEPITAIQERFGPHHYIVWFQHRRLPELLFEADLRRSFRFFMRRAGDTPQPTPEKRGRLLALRQAFEFFKADAQSQLLSPEELDVYVEAFRRTGFRGPIDWYRNMTRNWEISADLPGQVPHPALMITAENDPFLPPELAEGMERYVPDLETHMIPGCGHWTQQEQPDAVNRLLIDWLDHRFPLGPRRRTA